MTLQLAESLLLSEAVSPRALARGLFLAATQQMPLVQALLVTGAIDEAKIEEAVEKGAPNPLTAITPSLAIVQRLPRGFCSRLLAVPMGTTDDGAIDLAVLDTHDEHSPQELAFFTHAHVRVHRATLAAIRAAIEQIARADASLVPAESPAHGERSRTPIWGTPVVSVVPQAAPHTGAGDMPIPLMRRSSSPAAPPLMGRLISPDESAVLELRTPATPRISIPRIDASEPDTEREPEPVFALKPPISMRRPVALMIAETKITETRPENTAVTIPVPKEKEDARHTMVTTPAPPSRSEPPGLVVITRRDEGPRSTRFSGSRTQDALGGPRLPFPDATPILAAMDEANDRDAIVALLISGMRAVARRVAVLAVKRDSFVGWSCNAEFGDARAWRLVTVSSTIPSVLATAASGTAYLGPLFRTDGHLAILEFMKETSRDVAVQGVRVNMHPALVLLADELGDGALGTKRLEQLAKTAGAALARIIPKKPITKASS